MKDRQYGRPSGSVAFNKKSCKREDVLSLLPSDLNVLSLLKAILGKAAFSEVWRPPYLNSQFAKEVKAPSRTPEAAEPLVTYHNRELITRATLCRSR